MVKDSLGGTLEDDSHSFVALLTSGHGQLRLAIKVEGNHTFDLRLVLSF